MQWAIDNNTVSPICKTGKTVTAYVALINFSVLLQITKKYDTKIKCVFQKQMKNYKQKIGN